MSTNNCESGTYGISLIVTSEIKFQQRTEAHLPSTTKHFVVHSDNSKENDIPKSNGSIVFFFYPFQIPYIGFFWDLNDSSFESYLHIRLSFENFWLHTNEFFHLYFSHIFHKTRLFKSVGIANNFPPNYLYLLIHLFTKQKPFRRTISNIHIQCLEFFLKCDTYGITCVTA